MGLPHRRVRKNKWWRNSRQAASFSIMFERACIFSSKNQTAKNNRSSRFSNTSTKYRKRIYVVAEIKKVYNNSHTKALFKCPLLPVLVVFEGGQLSPTAGNIYPGTLISNLMPLSSSFHAGSPPSAEESVTACFAPKLTFTIDRITHKDPLPRGEKNSSCHQ